MVQLVRCRASLYLGLKNSEGPSLGGSVERQEWPEAESGVALWCLRRTEADEAVRAAAYGDGLAHADISLRLAKQAAEKNVHLNKTIMMENRARGMQKGRKKKVL